MCEAIETGTLPLEIYEFTNVPALTPTDEKLSPSQFRVHLRGLRRTAAETALSIEAELGELTPQEFEERLKDLDRGD